MATSEVELAKPTKARNLDSATLVYQGAHIAAERERWQLVLDARNEAIIGLRLSLGDAEARIAELEKQLAAKPVKCGRLCIHNPPKAKKEARKK